MSTPTPAAALAAYRRACDTHKRADWRMACHLLAAVVEASQGRPPLAEHLAVRGIRSWRPC